MIRPAAGAGWGEVDEGMAIHSRYPIGGRRTGRAASAELAQARASAADAPSPLPHSPAARSERATVGGIDCLVVTPDTAATGDMVYCHGGGYRRGSPYFMSGFLSQIAARTGVRIVAPRYALAPEEPYPAALLDVEQVIAQVTTAGPDRPLLLGGDSAGGGLAAAACLAYGENLPRLVGAVLLSPWLDLTNRAATFTSNAASDLLFSHASATEAADLYLQGLAPDLPLVSPLLADSLAGMPPSLLIAGGAEVLLHDSTEFAARLAASHIGVEMAVVPHMQHVSPVLFPDLPSTAFGLDRIVRFIRDRLGGGGPVRDDGGQG